MTRKIAKTLEEAAQFQFEDAISISILKNKALESDKEHVYIKEELSNMKGDIREILSILQNNVATGKKGVAAIQIGHEERIGTLEDYTKDMNTKFGIIAVIAGLISTFFMQLFVTKFIK